MNLVRIYLYFFTFALFAEHASAIPIGSNVALPISENHTVYRLQYKSAKNEDDKVDEKYVFAFAHGITGKTILIGVIPGKVSNAVTGLGDASAFLKHTVYQFDAPLYTSRLALVGGVKLPTGKNSLTSESTDWKIGAVYTMQNDAHEVDVSTLYSINTEAENMERGDTINHDLAYQFRIFPWDLPDEGIPKVINLVWELNGIFSQKSEVNGEADENSGGYRLFVSPGLQFVGTNTIFEGIVQIPVIQDLNGSQSEDRYRSIVSTRFQF